MERWSRAGRQALAHYCLRPLWRSLVLFGAVHGGPTVYHEVTAYLPAAHAGDPLARSARGGPRLRLPPGPGGPPSAHPERLREDLPLSETELLLARELWPAYDAGRRAADGG